MLGNAVRALRTTRFLSVLFVQVEQSQKPCNPFVNFLLEPHPLLFSVTHISWSLICNGDAAEDESVAVVFGGGARFTDTFEQLPYSSILPLSNKPLAGPHVDCLSLQLEVLRQEDKETEKTTLKLLNGKPLTSKHVKFT